MKLSIFVVLLITVIYDCQCSPYVDLSWINKMMENINQNVQESVERTQQQIDRTLKEQLSQVDRLIEQTKTQRWPSNGQTVVVNSSNGAGRSIVSGTGPDGKPYYRDIEDRIVNYTQYRTIFNYNATTDKMDVYHFTRDLSDPRAPFVPVNNATLH